MGIRLLHTSDLHIDWLFNKFSPGARAERRKELLGALDIIVNLAINQEVQAVMIAGDLFHSNQVDKHTVSRVWLSLERLTQKGIYVLLLPGNHDDDLAAILSGLCEKNSMVHIFRTANDVFSEINGLVVYGVPYNSSTSGVSPLAKIHKLEREGYHVAMLHGTVKTLPLISDTYGPIQPEQIENSGLDYIALGHFHNFQNCSLGEVKAYYPGTPAILSFDNTGERYVNIVNLEEGGVRVTPYSIPSRPYYTYEYNMTGKGLVDLYRQLDLWADSEVCLRLTLTGLVGPDLFPIKDQLAAQSADKFFHLEVVEQTILIPLEDVNDQTIKGIFIKKINERLKVPDLSEEDRGLVLEALRVGLTAIEGRRLD